MVGFIILSIRSYWGHCESQDYLLNLIPLPLIPLQPLKSLAIPQSIQIHRDLRTTEHVLSWTEVARLSSVLSILFSVYSQSYSFSSNHVWVGEWDHKEGWALMNWRFWTVVLEKTRDSPLDCKEIKPKEINLEYSLKGLMLKIKLQYFGHLMQRADSLEKILILGKIEGNREGGSREWHGWRASQTQWTWIWANSRR